MKLGCAGVHVLDHLVIGIESIPEKSVGQLVETIRASAAGTAGGTALVAARLGAEVRSLGAIGTDILGDTLLALLAREGVDTAGLVRKDGHQTSSSVLPIRPNGDRPAWHCIGANAVFTVDDVSDEQLEGLDHLHLGGPEFLGGDAAATLLQRAHAQGATTSVDVLAPGEPGMLEWIAAALPHTDYLLPNDEQVLGFTATTDLVEGARALVKAGAGCVAVTQGARGALVVTETEVVEVPAYATNVVDTSGCGDAFSAGFLRGRSLGLDLRGSAELGCATAAQVASDLGTDAGVYTLEDVRSFAATGDRLSAS
ncbi:carbohydrate kinase family protein [Cryptosporangium phraense]|uniref:Carbohydrate kinase family protein n=1 Tax=Cryptosporangium phraense TaxID=2593070 RepID=A0A545AUS7_9ACTN|nr:PfkB family carbohydrate kinase [Cryptosporangium phraense]TQS45063.1 carbohydrate kinase family protein [Cryptosporangium phraense]